MSKMLRCVISCNTKINTLIIMEIEAASFRRPCWYVVMAYLAQIVVCVWKQKKRDEKKGMCETYPGLNGKCDGEKPNDGIRFAVGQLISFRLVLQSLRRCFACKIFDFFAMRVKPWADHLIDFVHALFFQAGEQLNVDFLTIGVGFEWFFYRR